MTTYNYTISTDVTAGAVSIARLSQEVQSSSIVTALAGITTIGDSLVIEFKADLSAGDQTTLDGLVLNHSGLPLPEEDTEKRTPDGRLRVRSDSLPEGSSTCFTCEGDATDQIGGGQRMFWDFSNSDNEVTAPAGFKRKRFALSFVDPIWIKEGCLYFHGALKGSHIDVYIACPAGGYYLNRDGSPALASVDTPISYFIRGHLFSGDCPMGDELNTEVAQDNALPAGYLLVSEVTVPDTDNASYGWGSIEMYRIRSCLLPGETV